MKSKLLGASILALGLAAAPAFAFGGDDINVEGDDGAGAYATKGGTAVAVDYDKTISDNETNIASKNKLLSDNETNIASNNTAVFAKKEDVDLTVTKTSTKTETKIEDSGNNASGDGSLNASGRDSEAHLFSDNKTKIDTTVKTSTKTETKTETKIEDSQNGVENGNGAANAVGADSEANLNSKNKTFTATKTETKIEDSQNGAGGGDGSANASGRDSEALVNSKNKYMDNSVNVKVDDVSLSFETNTAMSKANLGAVTMFNKAETKLDDSSDNNTIYQSAEISGGSLNQWAGLNQTSVSSGANSTTQMNQQVTANIRHLTLN